MLIQNISVYDRKLLFKDLIEQLSIKF
jgi:hypothetical protein